MRNQPKYRFFANWSYAMAGLAEMLRSERSFRLELCVFVPLALSLFFWNFGAVLNLFLIFGAVFTLTTECINSAIERAVDLATSEIHPLAKGAKDTASTAVMMSLFLNAALWGYALIDKLL